MKDKKYLRQLFFLISFCYNDYKKLFKIFFKFKIYLQYNKYLEDINNWRHTHNFIAQKLVHLINNIDSRLLIKEYIQEHDPNNPIINILDSDYKLTYKSHDEIYELKNKKNNIYYWVTKWKDEMSLKLKKNKPIYNYDNSFRSIPLNLIINCSMVHFWTINKSVKLNMIKININSDFIINSKYYDFNYKKWVVCHRKITSLGEPEMLIDK